MTIRTFLAGSSLAAAVGSVAWLLIITQLDPRQAGAVGFTLFFLSLFVAIASLSALIGYGLRRVLLRRLFPAYAVRASIRQGILIAVFCSVLLGFQLVRLYQWWIAILCIAVLVCIEVVFGSYDHAQHRSRRATEN